MTKQKTYLNGCVVAFSGSFKAGTHTHLSELVRENGGEVVASVNKTTTHLVATKDDFNKPSYKVKNAQKHGDGTHIVTWDWVRQSIESKSKLAESEYSPGDGNSNDSTAAAAAENNTSNSTDVEMKDAEKNKTEITKTQMNAKEAEPEQTVRQLRKRTPVYYGSKANKAAAASVADNNGTTNKNDNEGGTDKESDAEKVVSIKKRGRKAKTISNDNNNVTEVNKTDHSSDEKTSKGDEKITRKRGQKAKKPPNTNNKATSEAKTNQEPEHKTATTTRKRARKVNNNSSDDNYPIVQIESIDSSNETNNARDDAKDDDSNTKKAKSTTKRRPNGKNSVHNKETETESDELLDEIANKGDTKDNLSKNDTEPQPVKSAPKRDRKLVNPPNDNKKLDEEVTPARRGRRNVVATSRSNK
ncbi:8434_t:CDS:1 [Ambispora gerdemannii]|uniref:8434_t:CDS:1 n=1 Tax=Ambispora gerdemannii TaxID=144530 RepID=A0A9N9CGU2_9GLOM|nr:8434_t:CDS:1 [Ambispora gerdemannii]